MSPSLSVLHICCLGHPPTPGLGAQQAKTLPPMQGLSGPYPLSGYPTFLGPETETQPWARAPPSSGWLGPAPRAPASELAPDAVAIETGSPHKDHGNKKEAPETMGPSHGGLRAWAKPSALSIQDPYLGTKAPPKTRVHLGWVGNPPKEGGSSSPSLSRAGQDPAIRWGTDPRQASTWLALPGHAFLQPQRLAGAAHLL